MPESNNSSIAIAVDIGGTHMRAAVVDTDGTLVSRGDIETRPDDGIEVAANRLADLIESICDEGQLSRAAGVGISSAGPIDTATGVYKNPPNLQAWMIGTTCLSSPDVWLARMLTSRSTTA